jgi:hypothetical protein
MARLLKTFWWMGLVALGVPTAWGYALIGPSAGYPGIPAGFGDAWEVPTIGYNPLPGNGLQTGPKNIGEEYRRNTPVMYYTCDANFDDYFGSNGVYAVDQAFAIFNSLTNVSSYSLQLTEFPLEATSINTTAEALGLTDLKSFTMATMMEQLGLAEPVRYIWDIHNRVVPTGNPPCPAGEVYLLVQRNFDPVPSAPNQLQYSSFVNGTLYSYVIGEACTGPNPLAQALPFAVDPTADTFTAVADALTVADLGTFFTSLTRDDVGGFRYLIGTNNLNVESTGPNTFTFVTNNNSQVFFGTNLALLSAQALTNDAVTLATLFPNIVITATSNTFSNVWVTNLTAYFTNYPLDPIGTPPHVAFATNRTVTVQTLFHHTFANVFSVQAVPGGFITAPLSQIPAPTLAFTTSLTNIVVVTNPPLSPPGTFTIATNSSSKTYLTNANVGEVLILPTNFCQTAILGAQLTNVIPSTNVVVTLTNTAATSNVVGSIISFTASRVDYFTNHAFVVLPITCPTNTTGLRQGIEKMTFIRRDFDSLLSRFFVPITNEYILTTVTNNALLRQRVRRVVTTPDFVFSAADLVPGPAVDPFLPNFFARNLNFNLANIYPGLAGPGTIETPTTITFNKSTPVFQNPLAVGSVPYEEGSQILLQPTWGSFDGTTNAPIVYPNGTSINDLMTQILVQVTPPYLAEGRVGLTYNQQIQVQSSTSTFVGPFTFSLSPGSTPLPPGLGMDSTGHISGIPSTDGFYDFLIRITDSQGVTIDRSVAIKVNP